MKNIFKNIKLFFSAYRLSFSADLEYRFSLINRIIAMLSHAALRVIIIVSVGQLGQGFMGWNRNELILLAGIHQIYVALLFLFIFRQTFHLIRRIFKGQLDYDLVKPVDSQLAVSLRGGGLSNIVGIFTGLAIVIYSLNALSFTPTFLNISGAIIFLLLGLSIVYALMFMGAVLNIWFDRLENAIEFGLRFTADISRFPTSAYSKINHLVFILLLPFTLVVSLPAKILLQRAEPIYLLVLFLSSIFFFYLARRFWFFALRHYTSASS